MKVINFSVPSGLQINIIPNNAKINDSIIETHLLFLKSFSHNVSEELSQVFVYALVLLYVT